MCYGFFTKIQWYQHKKHMIYMKKKFYLHKKVLVFMQKKFFICIKKYLFTCRKLFSDSLATDKVAGTFSRHLLLLIMCCFAAQTTCLLNHWFFTYFVPLTEPIYLTNPDYKLFLLY